MPFKPHNKRRPWQPQRKAQDRRLHNNNRFYTSSPWRKARFAYLSTHPFCECDRCATRQVPLYAEMVDHIQPINPLDPYDTQDGTYGEPLDETNFQAMNNQCHARKSGREAHTKHTS